MNDVHNCDRPQPIGYPGYTKRSISRLRTLIIVFNRFGVSLQYCYGTAKFHATNLKLLTYVYIFVYRNRNIYLCNCVTHFFWFYHTYVHTNELKHKEICFHTNSVTSVSCLSQNLQFNLRICLWYIVFSVKYGREKLLLIMYYEDCLSNFEHQTPPTGTATKALLTILVNSNEYTEMKLHAEELLFFFFYFGVGTV